jgi:hypothetical protein
MILSALESMQETYNGSVKDATLIGRTASWTLFLLPLIATKNYVQQDCLPLYRGLKRTLENTPSKDKGIVRDVIETLEWQINMLRNYVKSGEWAS